MSSERNRDTLYEELRNVLLNHALDNVAQEEAGPADAFFRQEPEHPPEFYAPSRKYKRRMKQVLRQARVLERKLDREARREEAKQNRLPPRHYLPRMPRWAFNLTVAGAAVLCFVVVAQGTGLNLFQYAFQRFDDYTKLSFTGQAASVSSEASPQTNEGWEEFYYPGVLPDGFSLGKITVNPEGCAYSADMKDESFQVRQLKGVSLDEYDPEPHSPDPVTVRETTVQGYPAKSVTTEDRRKILFHDGQILVEVSSYGNGPELVLEFAENLRRISTENFRLQKQWNVIYYPEYIPKGYAVTKFRVTNATIHIQMEDGGMNLLNIVIMKIYDGQLSMSYDTEDAKISDITVNGLEGVLTSKEGRSSAIWHDNMYNFSVFASLPADETLKIARSLKPADPSTLAIEYDIYD